MFFNMTSSKKGPGSGISYQLFSKKIDTNKHNMAMTKIEKLLKTTKKIGANFFRYDVIQEIAWFRVLVTPIFKEDGFY